MWHWACDLDAKNAEFYREYKKLTGEEPDPLMPEQMDKAIPKMPRDSRNGQFYQQNI